VTEGHSWPLFDTADLITGGIRPFITERRAKGISYRQIAEDLLALNIVVSHETVRAWSVRIEGESGDSADSRFDGGSAVDTDERLTRIEDALVDVATVATGANHVEPFSRVNTLNQAIRRLEQYVSQIIEERG
jgi:hypothetical protein